MIFSQIKQTLKGLRATRLFSAINIVGLALGITCALLLAKYVLYEASTDRFNKNYNRLYFSSINPTKQSNPTLLSPKRFFNVDYKDYPQIESSTIIYYNQEEEIVSDNHSYSVNILASDTMFSELFDFPMVEGDLKTIMTEPGSIAITVELAKKIFWEEDPIGEQILYKRKPYLVKGLLRKMNDNCSMNFDAVFSEKSNDVSWSKGAFDFILLKENSEIKSVNSQIADVGHAHPQFPESIVSFRPYSSFYFSYEFRNSNTFFRFGNKSSLYILGTIAFLILIISVFNFINIYNVTLIKRNKELGIKRVLGAGCFSISIGFVREVFLLTILATFISILLLLVLLPGFSNLAEKEMTFTPGSDIILYIGTVLIVTFLASLFPSIKYSVINPVKSVKEVLAGKNSVFVRKVLMSVQYIVTISLLIISMFFIKQLSFMLDKELGVKTGNIIKVRFFERVTPSAWQADTQEEMDKIMAEYKRLNNAQQKNIQYVVNEIEKNPYLQDLCFGNDPLNVSRAPWRKQSGDQDYQSVYGESVTPNALNLYGLKVVEGRFFDREIDQDRQQKIVINEAAKKVFGIKSLDEAFLLNRYWGAEKDPFRVIGVVKDFSFQHLSNSVQPLIMFFFDDKEDNYFMMHITKGRESESIAFLKNLFEEVNPTKDFKYEFVDDHVKSLYREDKKIARIYTLFAIVAIIISSLGLFSFSVFDVEQRFKEIGIRKVNGARETQVIQLLTRNFIVVIFISFLIACPVAWLAIKKYLENFANKADISGWLFLGAAFVTFFIAYATLIWQSWRAATRNPVEALRYE